MKKSKNVKTQKLNLNKVRVSKINNPEAILGGNGDDEGRTGEVSKACPRN